MTCTKRASEAERIIDRWIEQAAGVIEAVTGGARPDTNDLLYELADSEWIFCGGFAEDEETIIDMESALRQLSYIVERWIDDFKADQEDFDIDGIEPSEV